MSFALQGHACTVWDSLGRYWTHWDAKRYFGRKSNFNFLLLTILLIGECCLTIIYVAVMQRIDRKKKGNLDTWFTNLSLPFNINAQHSSVIKVISFLHCAFLLIILHFILCYKTAISSKLEIQFWFVSFFILNFTLQDVDPPLWNSVHNNWLTSYLLWGNTSYMHSYWSWLV